MNGIIVHHPKQPVSVLYLLISKSEVESQFILMCEWSSQHSTELIGKECVTFETEAVFLFAFFSTDFCIRLLEFVKLRRDDI